MVHTIEFTLPELLEQLHAGKVPEDAKVRVTFNDAALAPAQAENDPTLALFEQWEDEDAQLVPEAQADNARIYAEIEQHGIPRVRI